VSDAGADAVVADDDFLDEQSDDPLPFQHVQTSRLRAHTLEWVTERASEPQVDGLTGESA
jgi:hypothetical protein